MQFVKSYGSNYQGLRLGVVGFLAILGEGSVDTIAQVATLSYLIYLPRLIPAPQIFIRPSRPERLQTTAGAKVIGVHSGNTGEDIHHVAHALHRGDKLNANTVSCIRVKENDKPRPSINRFGPLAFLAILGTAMTCALLGLSIYYKDGMSLLATLLLSALSTVTGVANKWKPTPDDPKPDPHSPPGNVVIKYPQGAFIVVSCQERTARYLYLNSSERCIYSVKSTAIYRGLSLLSTLLLMGGVICLGNARIETQTAFAGSYMLVSIFYWIGAALPPAQHWDLSRFEVEQIEVSGGTPPRNARVDNYSPTYTEALWKAIAVTGTSNWVKEAGWAPRTPAWNDWLHEAEEAALGEPLKSSAKMVDGKAVEVWTIRNWDSRNALSTLLRSTTDKIQAKN
ncbi:hypothetical protein LTR41_002455 [Exophiala xenobiotica]|nr:hypothetical protein LTR41_002455 [Exophiala xenobiotica]